MKDHSSDIVKTDEVIGVTVKDAKNNKVGEIEEIVLDKVEGVVRYIVLSVGGILGMGDKYFAVPWKSICYSPNDQCFILKNMDKEQFKDAPGFDKNNWPNMSEKQWSTEVDRYYN